tara:strand:+ start:2246 stop:2638 length:393 start_codon:yes stop_codon:yes gene_type:complete
MNFKKLFPKYPDSPLNNQSVREELERFQREMPELVLDPDDLVLRFPATEDFSMSILGDLAYDDLGHAYDPVYRGVFTTYLPTENTFTEWYSEIPAAVKALSKLYREQLGIPKTRSKQEVSSSGIKKRKFK